MENKRIAILVGNRVKELRISRNYSQEVFADKIGIHRTYMGAIERGEKNITLVTAKKIAEGLEITISELLSGI